MSVTEDLRKLDLVESHLRGLKSRVTSAERYLNAQERQLREVLERKQELETRRKQHQAHIANLESETATLDERMEKFRKDLNGAATTKQYNAVLTELNTVKADKTKLEEQSIAEMESIEAVDAELTEIAAEAEERTKVRDVAAKQLEERTEEIKDRLEVLEAERAEAAAAVPDDVRAIFEDAADRNDGEAMAEVIEVSKRHREYACGACHMHMPFQVVAGLTTGGGQVVQCQSCQRILYLAESTHKGLVPK